VEWFETAGALGGSAILGEGVSNGAAFVERIEQGLPRRALDQLKRFSGLSDAHLSDVIPRRTLTSLKRARKLTADQSDRLARIAGIVAMAQSVFGDPELAREWLLTPNAALGKESPLRLLRTGSGAYLVESVLTRIEHGVYE
jgi:putative toxin-antitoxin system antitoxin component (TIGR02293 family)